MNPGGGETIDVPAALTITTLSARRATTVDLRIGMFADELVIQDPTAGTSSSAYVR